MAGYDSVGDETLFPLGDGGEMFSPCVGGRKSQVGVRSIASVHKNRSTGCVTIATWVGQVPVIAGSSNFHFWDLFFFDK